MEALFREIATGRLPTPTGRSGVSVERRSGRTLDSVRRTLRAALATAERRGLVFSNVAQGRIDAIPAAGRADASWWEPDQVALFLASIKGDELRALYEVAAFAGLRRGELLGLRWMDVDLENANGGLLIRQSLSSIGGDHACPTCSGTHRGRRLKSPKSAAGTRWVPLVRQTVTALTAHRDNQDNDGAERAASYVEHGLVFALPNGDPLRPDRVTKDFDAHAAAAGLPRIRLHELRHGACSLLLAAGVPSRRWR